MSDEQSVKTDYEIEPFTGLNDLQAYRWLHKQHRATLFIADGYVELTYNTYAGSSRRCYHEVDILTVVIKAIADGR